MRDSSETGEVATVVSYRGWAGTRRAFASRSALMVLLLGFGSGLPFLPIAASTLTTRLRDDGLDLGSIGLLSLASFFYLLRFLWTPLLDRYAFPLTALLGRRRSWLLVSQLGVAAGLFALASLRPEQGVALLAVWIMLASLAGATQDAVVDAYRIEIAPAQMQAALAATHMLGYRIGLILGGAGALYLAELAGWKPAYLAMSALMLLPVLATLLGREPVQCTASDRPRAGLKDMFWRPFSSFFARHGLAFGLGLLAFAGGFKFSEQVTGAMSGPFYLDSGYTKADIATVFKLYGVWIGIAGAFLGGICVAAFGFRRMLLLAALGVALSNLAFLLMAIHPGKAWALHAAISADNLAQGFAGAVLVAFLSSLTDRHFTATQYALLISLASLPGKFMGGVSGYLVEATSYRAFFLLSAASVIPTLWLLAWLWHRIREGAHEEEAG